MQWTLPYLRPSSHGTYEPTYGFRPCRAMTQRVVTVFSDEEFAKIKVCVEKYGLSMFGLAKMSIREFLEKHPKGPPK